MSQKKYICEKCNFYSDNKKDHTKHLHTVKHKKIQCVPPPIKECVIKYKCEKCDKDYLHHSSYYRHTKKCLSFSKEKDNMKDVIIKKQVDIIARQTKEAEVMRGLMTELITATREMVPKIGPKARSIYTYVPPEVGIAVANSDFDNAAGKIQIAASK